VRWFTRRNAEAPGEGFDRLGERAALVLHHEFEDVAIPIIAKYNGRLLLRVRPQVDAYIENSIDKPYEIHLVEFGGEQDFVNFMHDEDRKKFLHLKEQSIELSVLYKGGVKL
jgi:uncharacterized protein (DUF1330 family)